METTMQIGAEPNSQVPAQITADPEIQAAEHPCDHLIVTGPSNKWKLSKVDKPLVLTHMLLPWCTPSAATVCPKRT